MKLNFTDIWHQMYVYAVSAYILHPVYAIAATIKLISKQMKQVQNFLVTLLCAEYRRIFQNSAWKNK